MAGENALADFYGAILDTREKLGGDEGVDLELFMTLTGLFAWMKQDVKCASIAHELWVGADVPNEVSVAKPDVIYVLAQYMGRFDSELMGWEWGREMLMCPKRNEGDRIVHTKLATLLRPMSELKEYYCGRWRWFKDANAPKHGYPAVQLERRVRERPKSFRGQCKRCDAPGMFFYKGEWFCNDHRVI